MLQLTLFGRFALTGSNGTEIKLKSRKAKALLAYLAVSDGMSRSREEIMALLWSDRAETQARASLRQVLTGLRKALGESGAELLNTGADSISLNPDKITVSETTGEDFLAGLHIAYAYLGETEKAQAYTQDYLDRSMREIKNFPGNEPLLWRKFFEQTLKRRHQEDFEHFVLGARRAGLPI